MNKLAIFDFDGTLFSKDTLPYIGKVWKKQTGSFFRYYIIYLNIIPTLLLYKLKLIPRETLKYRAMQNFHRIFKGMSKEEIQTLFKNVYLQTSPYFNKKVIAEIETAQKEGYHTVLLSGAYTGLLEVIADNLGIDTVLGTELPFKEGKFDSQGQIPFINGESKQQLLENAFGKERIDWVKSRSFADSITDLPILTSVGQPVAVNPEPRLLKIAVSNNWRIISG